MVYLHSYVNSWDGADGSESSSAWVGISELWLYLEGNVCFSSKTGGLLHAATRSSWDWMDGWTSMTSSVTFLHHQLHLANLCLLSSARDSSITMVRCSGPDRFILNSNFPNEEGFWVSPFHVPTLQLCVCEILHHSRCSWAAHRTGRMLIEPHRIVCNHLNIQKTMERSTSLWLHWCKLSLKFNACFFLFPF